MNYIYLVRPDCAGCSMNAGKLRVAQIIEWDRCAQGCIALLLGDVVVSRHTDWDSARAAYRAAKRGAA